MEIVIRPTTSLNNALSYLLSSIATILFLGGSAAAGIAPVWLSLDQGNPLGITGIAYIAFMVLQAYVVLYLSFRYFRKEGNTAVQLGLLTGISIITITLVALFH